MIASTAACLELLGGPPTACVHRYGPECFLAWMCRFTASSHVACAVHSCPGGANVEDQAIWGPCHALLEA